MSRTASSTPRARAGLNPPVAPAPTGLSSRSSRYCSGSLPAAMAISSMKPCFTNDTPLVGGARSAPVGMSNGVTCCGVTEQVRDEAPRELVGGHDRVRAGDEIAKRDELAARVQAGLEVVVAASGRYWSCAMSSSRDHSSLTGTLGSPASARSSVTTRAIRADFDVVVAVQPPAESAAGAHEVERHVLGRDAGAERRILLGSESGCGDQISSLPSLIVRRGVLRLERRMRQQREEVLGLDDLRRGPERRLDVADHGAGGPPRPPPGAGAGGGAGAARRRLRRQLARLRQVPLAALRRPRRLRPRRPSASGARCWRATSCRPRSPRPRRGSCCPAPPARR